MLVLAGLAALLAACLDPGATVCASGRVCPAGRLCHEPSDRCVAQEQLDACTGLGEGDSCAVGDAAGLCEGGLCNALFCGDGLRSEGEACESVDLGGASCQSRGFYEDGDGLLCSAECTIDDSGCVGRCGDDLVNGPETCDPPGELGDCVAESHDAGRLFCTDLCERTERTCIDFGWSQIDQAGYLGGFVDAWSDGEVLIGVQRIGGIRVYDAASGWAEFSQPIENGGSYRSIWGTATSDLWVGALGSDLYHFDGATWATIPSGTSDVRDLHGFATDDIFAVSGAGAILHYDGTSWTPMAHPQAATALNAVWGAAPDDVWAVGAAGLILHWNGASWAQVSSPFLQDHRAVWGSGADDLWLAGEVPDPVPGNPAGPGRILHGDGSAWTIDPFVPARPIFGVMGRSASDVFAAGAVGLALHFDGGAWVDVGIPDDQLDNRALWVDARDAIMLVSMGPQAMPPSRHWQGGVLGQLAAGLNLGTIWGLDSGTFVACGATCSHSTSGTITTEAPPYAIDDLWGVAADDVFAAGAGGVAHFDGNAWTDVVSYPAASAQAVWGRSALNLWVAGPAGLVYHYNGIVWTPFDLQVAIRALWGSASADVYAVGDGGAAFHYDGAWTEIALPRATTDAFTDVWGSSASDVWLVGEAATAWHFDGAAWSTLDLPGSLGAGAKWVSGSAPDAVVFGSTGELLAWNGVRLAQVALPFLRMNDVFATAGRLLIPGDVMAGEAGGVHSIVHTLPL